MSLVATLEALRDAGATADMLIAVVRTHEAERERAAADRKARDAQRKRDERQKASEMSTDIQGCDGTSRDSAGPSPRTCERSARVVNPISSSLRSEEVGGGGGGECAEARSDDWPEGKATDHVRLLVDAVASPRLDPSKSPGLITTSGRLAAWKREGASWEHDVVPVVTALCAKQRSPVSTWKFFDQAIGRSMADNRQALEIPPAGEVVPFRSQGPPSFADKLSAERAEARRRALEDG